MAKADLEKKAESLGIKVDGRWSESRIKQEIEGVSEDIKPEEKLFPVKLLKHYRPAGRFTIKTEEGEDRDPTGEEEEKVRAGARISLPLSEAKNVISKKIADRDDEIG